MRARPVLLWLLAIACGSEGARSSAPSDPVRDLYALEARREPAILWAGSADELIPIAPALQLQLHLLRPHEMAMRARVIVQNDAWGLAYRLRGARAPALAALRAEAEQSVRALAPAPDALEALPAFAAPAELGPGFRELGSELPVLNHERLFALRRLFHVFFRGDDRALVGELVAIDAEGRPHLTGFVSEIEQLHVESEGATHARVFELERYPQFRLREERAIARVPGLGADRFLIELDPAVPIETLPCRRCHDTAEEHSLPRADLDPVRRHRALLDQIVAPWLERSE